MSNKLPKFSLSTMTCAELADWLETPPKETERKAAREIRERFHLWDDGIDLLRKCGNLSAVHHLAHIKTARHLSAIPEVELMVGGGKPELGKLPRFSKSLKKMAEANGLLTVHRWGKGAFTLKRKEQ